jgi:hypothetical protein
MAGREKLLSFGVYTEVPTVLARERRDESQRRLAAGRDLNFDIRITGKGQSVGLSQ